MQVSHLEFFISNEEKENEKKQEISILHLYSSNTEH